MDSRGCHCTCLSVSLCVWFLAEPAGKTIPNCTPCFALSHLIQYLLSNSWYFATLSGSQFILVCILAGKPTWWHSGIYSQRSLCFYWTIKICCIYILAVIPETLKEECYMSYGTICFMQSLCVGSGSSWRNWRKPACWEESWAPHSSSPCSAATMTWLRHWREPFLSRWHIRLLPARAHGVLSVCPTAKIKGNYCQIGLCWLVCFYHSLVHPSHIWHNTCGQTLMKLADMVPPTIEVWVFYKCI